MKCKDCKWFEFRDKQLKSGYCRKNAPHGILRLDDEDEVNMVHRAKWPWVSITDWCGEFEDKYKSVKKKLGIK